jgi:hypothetical protein
MRSTHFIYLIFLITFSSCSNESRFPTEKRYWSPEDYNSVIYEIGYRTPQGEEYPRFSNPETALVIKKLVDTENYKVILDDSSLGLNHRNEVAQAFFEQYKDLLDVYQVTDKQDMYVYSDEVVEIEKFGLGLQVLYFKLGNDKIREQSDNSDDSYFLKTNEKALINNFNLYLDEMNHERYFQQTSLPSYAEGLTVHFNQLFEAFPSANFNPILEKANSVIKKVKSKEIRSALESLISKLELMKKEKEEKQNK